MANRRVRRTSKFSEYLIANTNDLTQMQRKPNSTQLGRGAVTSSALAGQVVLTDNVIQSNNYVPGATGWIIDGSGNAEFGNVYVRGSIHAESGSIGYWNISEPLVTRTFGDSKYFGTVIESQNLGSSDENVTSGTYVALFKSYIDIPEQIDSAARSSNLATLTIPDHNYLVGDYVNISIPADTTYNASNALILGITDSTITYQNVGSDSASASVTGTCTLSLDDVAGLYLRDYGKTQFDYGYFSNKGISYVSAEDINIVKNPSFEYNGSNTTSSWSVGSGLSITSEDFNAASPKYKSSTAYGANVTWSTATSNYLTSTVDYSSGNSYKIFTANRILYFDFTVFPKYVPSSKSIGNLILYSLKGNVTSATANGSAITYTGTGLNFSAGQYITITGFSNPVCNIANQKLVSANTTTLVVNVATSVGSGTASTANNASTGLIQVVVPSGTQLFYAGDTAFLDVDAGIYDNTYGEITSYYSPHTIADGTQGYTYTVSSYPAPNATTFYLQTEYGSVSNGTGLITETHSNSDGTSRSQYVFKAYELALDLSAITFKYPNSNTAVSISDVLSTSTSAIWSSDSTTKYLLSTANSYMLGYLDSAVGVSAMKKNTAVLISASNLDTSYLNTDSVGYQAKSDISFNIPGWLYLHDGSGVVPASPTKVSNISYIVDNFYLSTASNFFYGSGYGNVNWYDSTNLSPNQASVEGTKTWLDVNLDSQSANLDYFDYISFRNNSFSGDMAVRPSLTVIDSTNTLVVFPDTDYEVTTLTGGTYQYSTGSNTYNNVTPSLKLLTGTRSASFELTAIEKSISNAGAETVSTGVAIAGMYDQNHSRYSTLYTGSDKFIWTAYPEYLTNEQIASVVFTSSSALFNQKIVTRSNLSVGSSITASGFIQAGGAIYTSSGNIRTWNGNLYTNVGSIYTSSGDIYASSGNIYSTTGNIVANIGGVTANTIRLNSTTDLSLSSTAHAFQIGPTNAANMRIDQNEVQAVNNGAAADLYIEASGGDTIIGQGSGNLILGSTSGSPTTELFYKWAWSAAIGTSRPLSVASSGLVGYAGSSKEFKQDIKDLVINTSNVLSVVPKQFKYKTDVEQYGSDAEISYGFIAEDLDELGLSPFVDYDENGKPFGINYSKYVVALQAVVKYQDQQLKSLSDRLDRLEGK